MGNNNKMIENYVQYIWLKYLVILDWFPFSAEFFCLRSCTFILSIF